MDGEFFVGAALGTTLTKLALRYAILVSDIKKRNRLSAEAMLVLATVLHLGRSGLPTKVCYCLVLLFKCQTHSNFHVLFKKSRSEESVSLFSNLRF
jgi:hypothetical protein